MLDQLGDPGRVGHVGLAAGHVAQMPRVARASSRSRLPAGRTRTSRTPRSTPSRPPSPRNWPASPAAAPGQRSCPKRADLAVPPAVPARDPHARGDRRLVHVQPGDPLDEPVHLLLPPRHRHRRRPEEPHHAASRLRARSNNSGCPRLPRPTDKRAHSTKAKPTSPGDHATLSCAGVARQGHGSLIRRRPLVQVLAGPLPFLIGMRPLVQVLAGPLPFLQVPASQPVTCDLRVGASVLFVPLATRDGSSLTAEAAATGPSNAAASAASRPATHLHPPVRQAAQSATMMPGAASRQDQEQRSLRSWTARRCRWQSLPAAPRRS
jgi:hypothetical protein